MTDDEARRLATRIVDTWPNGTKGYIWRDELIRHRYTAATRALEQLTATTTARPPMPGDLTALITQLQAAPTRNALSSCTLCDGSGYVDGDPIYETVEGQAHAYTTVTPCRCQSPDPPPRQRYDDRHLFDEATT